MQLATIELQSMEHIHTKFQDPIVICKKVMLVQKKWPKWPYRISGQTFAHCVKLPIMYKFLSILDISMINVLQKLHEIPRQLETFWGLCSSTDYNNLQKGVDVHDLQHGAMRESQCLDGWGAYLYHFL